MGRRKKAEIPTIETLDNFDFESAEVCFIKKTVGDREVWIQTKAIKLAGGMGGKDDDNDNDRKKSKVAQAVGIGLQAIIAVAVISVGVVGYQVYQEYRENNLTTQEALNKFGKGLTEEAGKSGAENVLQEVLQKSTSTTKETGAQVASSKSSSESESSNETPADDDASNGENSYVAGVVSVEQPPGVSEQLANRLVAESSYKNENIGNPPLGDPTPHNDISDLVGRFNNESQAQNTYNEIARRSSPPGFQAPAQGVPPTENRAVVNESESAELAAAQVQSQIFDQSLIDDFFETIPMSPMGASETMIQ